MTALPSLLTPSRVIPDAHAGIVAIVVGAGDGSVVRAIRADPIWSAKEVHLLVLPGEDCAEPGAVRIAEPQDAILWAQATFSAHHRIPLLAGLQVADRHPLAPAAAAARAALQPVLLQALADLGANYGNDVIDGLQGVHNACHNARTLLSAPSLVLQGVDPATPVVAIGAGPSLARSIDQLRALQGRAILVACDAVLGGLLDAGIVPHLCTPLERLAANAALVARARGTGVRSAAIAVCHPATVAAFDRHAWVPALDRIYEWMDGEPVRPIGTGSSTGVLAAAVGRSLGRGTLFLVGHDCARGPAGTHWSGSAAAADDLAAAMARMDTATSGYAERVLPGNAGAPVSSQVWWDVFRHELATIATSGERAGLGRTINVAAHHRMGAVIPGTHVGDLPDPAGLPVLPPPEALAWGHPGDAGRWDRFARHARDLGRDAVRAIRGLRANIAAIDRERERGPGAWSVDRAARACCIDGMVEHPRNAAVLSYLLRSALYSRMAIEHARGRVPQDHAHAAWQQFAGIRATAVTLTAILEQLAPTLIALSAAL